MNPTDIVYETGRNSERVRESGSGTIDLARSNVLPSQAPAKPAASTLSQYRRNNRFSIWPKLIAERFDSSASVPLGESSSVMEALIANNKAALLKIEAHVLASGKHKGETVLEVARMDCKYLTNYASAADAKAIAVRAFGRIFRSLLDIAEQSFPNAEAKRAYVDIATYMKPKQRVPVIDITNNSTPKRQEHPSDPAPTKRFCYDASRCDDQAIGPTQFGAGGVADTTINDDDQRGASNSPALPEVTGTCKEHYSDSPLAKWFCRRDSGNDQQAIGPTQFWGTGGEADKTCDANDHRSTPNSPLSPVAEWPVSHAAITPTMPM